MGKAAKDMLLYGLSIVDKYKYEFSNVAYLSIYVIIYRNSSILPVGLISSKSNKSQGDSILFSVSTSLELKKQYNHIYQPLRSGRIWHKVNF